MKRRILALAVSVLAWSACEETDGNVLTVDAQGLITGQASVDVNGNGIIDDPDTPYPSLLVRVGFRGVADTIASAVTNQNGTFEMIVPVGEYTVRIDPETVPDSLVIVEIQDPVTVVKSGEETPVTITAGYPAFTIEEARALPTGRRAIVEGNSLNADFDFQNGVVHVAEGSLALRAFGLSGTGIERGNRVRVVGTTARRDGEPTLEDALGFVLGDGDVPEPVNLTTARAATADGGELDAALVRVTGATVASSVQGSGELRFILDDGSGPVDAAVRLDGDFDLLILQPGTRVDVTGLLSASGNRWRLMPRNNEDVSLGFPTVTVSEARALPVGRTVIVTGTALNSRNAFTDTTVHVSDETGAMRTTRVRPGTVLAGDLVRFIGTTARRNGQPVLDDVSPVVLDDGALPEPIRLSTAAAASASNGSLDAAQVQVREVTVIEATTVGQELHLRVNDGSGVLVVRVRTDIGIDLEPLDQNAILDITGLLVPDTSTSGTWRLRVRTEGDIGVISS